MRKVLRKNVMVINFGNVTHRVKFRSVFRSSSSNFKILAIHNVLSLGKSYEDGFAKKCVGHKLYAMSRVESSFDRFFMHRLGISKH
ncbi:hypothetical protein BHE74_00057711 [Ensete ventricosum]|nr:hypothetical protein BHE74_00057711 [Ensete ventricosum]